MSEREIDALIEQRAVELLTAANPDSNEIMRIEAKANWRSAQGADFADLLSAHQPKDWPDITRRLVQDYWMTKFRIQAEAEIKGGEVK